jgi:hypothetical protein
MGRSAFEAGSATFLQSIAAIRHEFLKLREVHGGKVITAMTVHYDRLDGRQLTLPCCNLSGTCARRVHDYRVYMDIDPVLRRSGRQDGQRPHGPQLTVSDSSGVASDHLAHCLGLCKRDLPRCAPSPARSSRRRRSW